MSDLASRVKEIINSIIYINIASVSTDNKAWNTPVYAAHDPKYNFYWSSWLDANHSQNIRFNKNIFITIYDTTRNRGDNKQRCVYIQAEAKELEDAEDISEALKYFKGLGNKELKPADFKGDKVKRLYRAIPRKVWLNDLSERQVTKETDKMRIEVPIQDLVK